jgi:hypothetical protein
VLGDDDDDDESIGIVLDDTAEGDDESLGIKLSDAESVVSIDIDGLSSHKDDDDDGDVSINLDDLNLDVLEAEAPPAVTTSTATGAALTFAGASEHDNDAFAAAMTERRLLLMDCLHAAAVRLEEAESAAHWVRLIIKKVRHADGERERVLSCVFRVIARSIVSPFFSFVVVV